MVRINGKLHRINSRGKDRSQEEVYADSKSGFVQHKVGNCPGNLDGLTLITIGENNHGQSLIGNSQDSVSETHRGTAMVVCRDVFVRFKKPSEAVLRR